MTDELVIEARKGGPCAELGDRCRAIEAASGCFCAAVADRIEQLTAERDEMAMSCLSADGEAQRAWDAQKAAEAERDRLRETLAEADRQIVWEGHGFGNDFASRVEAALKGETL